ncbi:uncharacterized protein LOC135848560 [Planococcus citri]|uniref:uncharacterized protein LOC135848560 n=1 Tax=Planococcus citri TaxID=170843 RepID=UPI0031F83BBF
MYVYFHFFHFFFLQNVFKMQVLICSLCCKSFAHHSSLSRHKKQAHRTENEKKRFICDRCGFDCTNKKVLIRHMKNDHLPKRKNSVRRSRLKCPNCDTRLTSYALLDQHLTNVHEINIEEKHLEFENEGEFCIWKRNIEKTCNTRYIAERGLRKYKTHSQREFICQRSYDAILKSVGRRRSIKRSGSSKINSCCPSRMIVKISEKISVKFIRQHVGHAAEIIRMRIPSDQPDQCDEIAGKSKDGVSIQQDSETIATLRFPFHEEDKHEKIKIEVQSKLRLALTWSNDLPIEHLENLSRTLDTVFQKFGFSRKGEKNKTNDSLQRIENHLHNGNMRSGQEKLPKNVFP